MALHKVPADLDLQAQRFERFACDVDIDRLECGARRRDERDRITGGEPLSDVAVAGLWTAPRYVSGPGASPDRMGAERPEKTRRSIGRASCHTVCLPLTQP